MNKLFKFLLICVLAVCLIAGCTYFIPEKKPDVETSFTVSSTSGELLYGITEEDFTPACNYTFKVNKAFTVDIVPNVSDPSNNFTYYVDGGPKHFFGDSELNLSKAFNVSVKAREFTVSVPTGATVEKIFKTAYEGKTVEMQEEIKATQKRIFTIVIKEKDGKSEFKINFGLTEEITGISILPERIIF